MKLSSPLLKTAGLRTLHMLTILISRKFTAHIIMRFNPFSSRNVKDSIGLYISSSVGLQEVDEQHFVNDWNKDGQRFHFIVQEANTEPSTLLDGSDAVLITFALDTDFKQTVLHYAKFIYDNYWEQRKAFYFIGTKLDALDAGLDIVQYPERETTKITMYTYLSTFFIDNRSKSDLGRLCSSLANFKYPIRPSIGSSVNKLFSHLRSRLCDLIAMAFALPVPRDINKDTPDPDDFPAIPDDDTAWKMIDTPESIDFNNHIASFANSLFRSAFTYKVGLTLVLKRLHRLERFNTIFIRAYTNIPVPQPRYRHLKEAFITDFIPGRMLLECWDSLTKFQQFRIACTLRRYVSQLRSITSERPGSIEHGHVNGALFSDPSIWNGPFRDVEIFRNWVKHIAYYDRVNLVEGFRSDYPNEPPPPAPPMPPIPDDTDWKLSLAHCDISLSNVILSEDGVLWLIDWAYTGFYPPWLESHAMKRYTEAPDSWKQWISFITDFPSNVDELWAHMDYCVSLYSSFDAPREDYWPLWPEHEMSNW
ncbi:hypothetical protein JR316_0001282 [Psilocybe cubensis]|uniref:Aminoglycoside phosphotransferase domain-containing protein n=2 Tax=Psilocybe cubensis TaxID=181762 RepID=A0A8H8CR27_PSICU|nr:hypothetical protein JR316_0001282 [Psilocybe cubensis]KAH9487213.1 hypothetical protein JR316_0001282 [Psilocybe cubensis]